MKRLLLLGAVALLASCNKAAAPAENAAIEDNLAAETNVAEANAAAPAAMSLLNTSWEFSDQGKPMVISIDPAGAYIVESADGKHIDHGTYALTNGKDCFTSAMGEKATECYSTSSEVAIGQWITSTDDKGVANTYKRVEYRALKLPG